MSGSMTSSPLTHVVTDVPVVFAAGGAAPVEVGGAVSVSAVPIADGDACWRVRVLPPAWET